MIVDSLEQGDAPRGMLLGPTSLRVKLGQNRPNVKLVSWASGSG